MGQRIFWWATPDFLIGLNAQNELNVHNINLKIFERLHQEGTTLLCVITGVAFFCRQDRLLGIPLPSTLLMFGFLLTLFYAPFSKNLFFVSVEQGLLLLFIVFALVSRQAKWVIAAAATLALELAVFYVNYRGIAHPGEFYEVREYLFGIACLFYAFELWLAQRRRPAIPWTPFTRLKLPGGRIPFWLATCSMVIAGSIGLAVLQYVSARAEATATEETYQSIMAGEPVVRSNFDIYLIGNRLIYFREFRASSCILFPSIPTICLTIESNTALITSTITLTGMACALAGNA